MSTTGPRTSDGILWTDNGWKSGLSTDAVTSSTTRTSGRYDVIVIGAGFAGLIAARDLSRLHGLRVLLIEARDRIGGRTWTAKELGEDIEMGGTWIHWSQPHLYSELDRYGLCSKIKPTVACMAPEQAFHNFGKSAEALDVATAIQLVDDVAQKFLTIDGLTSRDLMPYPHDPFKAPAHWLKYDHLTVDQRFGQLDLPQRDQKLFEAYISLFGCSKPGGFSFTEVLRWYALAGHSMANVFEQTSVYKIGDGGMTSVAKALLDDTPADRLFNTQVRRIHQNGSGAHVFTTGGQKYTASTVITTIPLNCLKDVEFKPPLSPLRQEAVVTGQLNKGAKLHFRLREKDPLWFATANVENPTPFLLAFADHNGTHDSPSGTYVVAAAKSGGVADMKDSRTVIRQFKQTFRQDVDVDAFLVHDWSNDPFSQGQWSCWGPGAASKYLKELQKPHGQILFASSDWANGWRGFIDGAMESGKRAARDAATICSTTVRSTL